VTPALRALFRKELLDLARNRSALLPVVIVTLLLLVMPFAIVFLLPIATGRPLVGDADLARAVVLLGAQGPSDPEARIQLFLFQQFLLFFLVTPITGAMSLASHAVVGEKQARTLEPLLATPMTTGELLVAKVLGALAPTLAISLAGVALYGAGIAAFARPGVAGGMITARTLWLIAAVGPGAGLVALQSAIVISSRVNDPRTAQQFGVLIIVPLTALIVAQFTGSIWLSAAMLAAIGAGLIVVWVLLLLFSIAMFERESILTRWR
jgi:ABC-2 type transport system permease protein